MQDEPMNISNTLDYRREIYKYKKDASEMEMMEKIISRVIKS